jgi:predicted RNA-binding protein with PUA-like domain
MKSEPEAFSITDLERVKVSLWDGVRNYQVRNMLRDQMHVGDRALFYHSNTKEIGCVGVMEIVRAAYPDPTQFDSVSQYFDAASKPENPRWLAVDVQFVEAFARVVTLAEIKHDPTLRGMLVAVPGSRLSVTPVSKNHFDRICMLARTK